MDDCTEEKHFWADMPASHDPVQPVVLGFGLSRRCKFCPTPYDEFVALIYGQEARRITTPPLKEATADGRVRSLFAEVDNFDPDEGRSEADNRSQMSGFNNGEGESPESGTKSSSDGSKRNMAYIKAAAADVQGGGYLHWFDSKKEEDERKKQWVKEKKKLLKSRPGIFSLTVPEHLPNSPLCPANPKHVSGGTGVCVVSFNHIKRAILQSLICRSSIMAESRTLPSRSSRLSLSWGYSSQPAKADSQLRSLSTATAKGSTCMYTGGMTR